MLPLEVRGVFGGRPRLRILSSSVKKKFHVSFAPLRSPKRVKQRQKKTLTALREQIRDPSRKEMHIVPSSCSPSRVTSSYCSGERLRLIPRGLVLGAPMGGVGKEAVCKSSASIRHEDAPWCKRPAEQTLILWIG